MEYKVIKTEEEFLQEKEYWNAICNTMLYSTPFQTFEWNYFWWKNNEPENSLYIIKAYQDKTVFGYAPLVVKNNIAEFIGGRDMDYGQFVVSDKEMSVIEGFIHHLLDNKILFSFQEMPARTTQLHMVQRILESTKNVFVRRTTRASYVVLSKYSSYEEYYKLLSKSMRNKTIKYGLKQGLILKKEEVSETLFNDIKEIYSDRQEVRGGAEDITWAFAVIASLNEHGLADVYMARNDKLEPVGFLVCLIYNANPYIWLVAFKHEYHTCFPGQLLFNQVIKDAFENHSNTVDFMRGDYDFKMRWECELDSNYTVCLCANRLQYMLRKNWYSIRPKIKKIVYDNESLKRFYKKHAK